MIVLESDAPSVTESDIAIFDLADASRTCSIPVPGGPSPAIAVSRDGTIYAAIQPHKETEFTTDAGHLDVYSPNGRLIHRISRGLAGIWDLQLDDAHHRLYIEVGTGTVVDGAVLTGRETVVVYDAETLRPLHRFTPDDDDFRAYALSPDGAILAMGYEPLNKKPHIDLIDTATYRVIRRIETPVEQLWFTGNVLHISSQHYDASMRVPGGTPAVGPTPSPEPAAAIDGIVYAEHDGDFALPGQGVMHTTYTRTRLADGATLPPIVADGIDGPFFVVHPSAAIAAATPGPELAPLRFPSAALLRADAGTRAGIAFDDSVNDTHYEYLGDLARSESRDGTVTVVDCRAGIAYVANTQVRQYYTLAMDPLPTSTPTPMPVLSPAARARIARAYPQLTSTISVTMIPPSARHVPTASIAYRATEVMRYGSQSATMMSDREYAVLPMGAPSCANRTFAHEPPAIVPGRDVALHDPLGAILAMSGDSEGARLPRIPHGAFLVYAESQEPSGPPRTLVHLTGISSVPVSAFARFAPPAGYLQIPAPNY